MPTALGFAITVLTDLPSLISAGVNVVNLIKSSNASLKAMQLEGRNPSDEEWAALDAMIENLRGQLPVV